MLADRVHAKRNGMQTNLGLSFILPVCDLCGVLLVDQGLHDEWHEKNGDATEPFMEIIGGSVRAEQTQEGDTE